MRLRALRLWNLRRFAGSGVALEGIADGVNVLAAPNEEGKSTCFDALHALFFLPHGSAAKAAKALRPYSGGSPRIEADLETPEGRFRLRKQYFGGARAEVIDLATGRLIAQADEAEAWIAHLMEAAPAGGPAGLLWVRQGAIEFGMGGKAETDAEHAAREDVLGSVAGEVEDLTGGRRMAAILARVETDLGVNVTATGRPRTHGPYARALAEVDSLEDDLKRHEAQLAELRQALETRRAKAARLTELDAPDARADRAEAREAAARALAAARASASRLDAARAEAELSATRARAAAEALERFRVALETAADLATRDREARARAEDAAAAVSEAAAAETRATAAREAAALALQAARDRQTRATEALRAAERAARRETLAATLARAEAAQKRQEEAEAERAAAALPAGTVAGLERAEAEIREHAARARAEAATLTLEYGRGAPRILRDGAPLEGGTPHLVVAPLHLDLPGIGRLTVTPGAGASGANAEALAKAEARRATLLRAAAVESLAAARSREERARDAAGAAALAASEVKILAPDGLAALRTALARLGDDTPTATAEDEPPPDPAAAEVAVQAAETALARAEAARDAARAGHGRARETRIAAEAAAETAREAHARSAAELGPEPDRAARRAALAAASAEATAEAAARAEARAALETATPDLEVAEAAFQRAESVQRRAESEARDLEVAISGLTGRIQSQADEGLEETCTELRGELDAARARLAAIEAEVAALTRLRSALEAARSAAREQYFGPVLEELRPLLGLLFDEAAVRFGESSLLPETLTREGQDESVEILSGGMREQLAILTRLAFARLLARGGRPVPVVLDDALVFTDDARIERMFDALHRQARDMQVIVLTCRQRAFERLGGEGLALTPWRPDDL
ncbi:AAA family ATPase [Rhodobacteraceae bacterium DSL-40]|uniref:AAA family ATPase n=1 Tax=Amaricoccus sp. B4 TaxID=3368557 RepID=UPI000DAD1ECB